MTIHAAIPMLDFDPDAGDTPHVFSFSTITDDRGWFVESMPAHTGDLFEVKQANTSCSRAGVFRGLHWQDGTAKYVSCVSGQIVDYVLDLRLKSKTFGCYSSVTLPGHGPASSQVSAIFVPAGFAHGFLAEQDSVVSYLQSQPYCEETARRVNVDSPHLSQLRASLPVKPIRSAADITAPAFDIRQAPNLLTAMEIPDV